MKGVEIPDGLEVKKKFYIEKSFLNGSSSMMCVCFSFQPAIRVT